MDDGKNPVADAHWEQDERGWRPTPRQELLLRASLLDGAEAVEAWGKWKVDVDMDRLDVPSFTLLPLLYENMLGAGVADPLIDELKKYYTMTWYNNQIRLDMISGVLAELERAGIQTIILKGAAMTIAYYNDHGARPMGDVDVLIRRDDVALASAALAEAGYNPTTPITAARLRYMHGGHFLGERGSALDLHWRLLWEIDTPEAAADCWKSSREVVVGRVSTRVLDPTHQFLHVCVHGARWNSAPLRWVADAVTIVSDRESKLDFEQVSEKAAELRLHVPVCQALRYLREAWSVAVPERVLTKLEAMPTSRIECAYYGHLARNRERTLLGNLPVNLFHFTRFTRDLGPVRRLLELLRFLALMWGLDRVVDVPLSMLKKAGRRAWIAVRSLFAK